MSELEETFALQLRALGVQPPEREYRFCPGRRWRFDFSWVGLKLAVEIEGGTWIRGRHTRPMGFAADCSKYNRATIMGWRVLRYTEEAVNDWSGARETELALRELQGAAVDER